MPIMRTNEFQSMPGQGPALREFLGSVISLIREAPGCRSVRLYSHHDDPTRLVIIEEWDSVEKHQAAASRIPPELMQKAMALFAAPPKGAYYHDVEGSR